MTLHTITVRDRRISTDSRLIAAGGVGSDYLALDLDADWEGLTVNVVLGSGADAMAAEWDGEPMEFPAELAQAPGWVPVSVVGMAPDGGVRMTTFRCDRLLQVGECGETGEVGIGVAMA